MCRAVSLLLCMVLLMGSALAVTYDKLQRGDNNAYVLAMQNALKSLGYDIVADGNFGSGTLEAVKAFQKANKLDADGVAGQKTLELLYALAPAYAPASGGSTSPTATPGSTKLQDGDSGADVLNLQNNLIKLGYSLKADGKFGDTTKAAVKAFQKAYGLTADGIAGTATLNKINQVLASPTATPTSSSSSDKLQEGDSGPYVLLLQNNLVLLGYSVKADGKFGDDTKEAVKAFQKAYGLTVDGVAGTATLNKINQVLSSGTTVPTAQVTATPTPASGSSTLPTSGKLKKGDSGPAVVALQTALKNLGYSLTIDGSYGTSTYNVVRAFQKAYGLTVDGIAGANTLNLLSQLSGGSGTPTATPASVDPSYTLATVYTGNDGKLNLRAEKKSGGNILATIPNGTVLSVTDKGSEWCAVTYLGTQGYVMTQYLIFTGSTLPTATPTVTPSPTPTVPSSGTITATVYTSNGGSLNLRADNKSGAKVMDTIKNGTVLTVLQQGSSWCQVLYNGQIGYVMTSFLIFTNAPTATPTVTPTPTPTTPSGGSAYAKVVTGNGGKLNLRAEADGDSKVLAGIPNGTTLLITSKGATWCTTTYLGTSGYVMTSFLDFTSTTPDDDTPDDADPSKYTRTLKSGMTGEDVRWVQERLKELGYTVTVNGTYDSTTIAAVKAFQTQNALTSDGLAGQQTFTMLASSNARRADATPLSYTTLRIDDVKSGVTTLQTALKNLQYNLTVNGTYDVATHNAVVAFQQRNNLVISGIADALTQTVLYSGSAKSYSTAVDELPAGTGLISGPSTSEVKLLHWQTEIKPTVSSGQTILIYDPDTSLSWNIKFYSLGRHADSEPLTWQDTQIMNRSFGKSSWDIQVVYIRLPDGRWTMATMHNRPHLYGSITNNGFGGHLCIHFLRDMDEAKANDPNYGVDNQTTLRNAWKKLTGITVD